MTTLLLTSGIALNSALLVGLLFYIRHKHRILYRHFGNLELAPWNAQSLHMLMTAGAPLPKAGGWAASVDFLTQIISLLREAKPEHVVELGSGLSTLIIAAELRRIGRGSLTSIQHDPDYAAITRCNIALHGLQDYVDLRIAPLMTNEKWAPEVPWYDVNTLSDLQSVDLLIIDGPPMPVHPLVRSPALPFFMQRFSPRWTALLDDASRKGEQEILQQWKNQIPNISIRHLALEKGAALITPYKA